MKLDFSILSTPAKKSGGQMGTLGTQVFAELSASPELSPEMRKGGDRLTAPDVAALLSPPASRASAKMGTLQSSTSAMSPLSPPVPMKNDGNDFDWQEFYNERMNVAERIGKMPRDRAKHMAYESCIVRWLDTHPAVSSPDICAHCQRPSGAPGTSSVPVYSGQWLHHACLDPWQAARRQEAIAALAKAGIKTYH